MHSINHDYFAFTAFFKFLRNIEKYRIFFLPLSMVITNIKYMTCHHQSKYNREKSAINNFIF